MELFSPDVLRVEQDSVPLIVVRSLQHQVVVARGHGCSRDAEVELGVEGAPEIVSETPALTLGQLIELRFVVGLPRRLTVVDSELTRGRVFSEVGNAGAPPARFSPEALHLSEHG